MIRTWFGIHQTEKSDHDNEKVLDDLLKIFRGSLCRYYHYYDRDIESIQHLVALLKTKKLSKGEELFLHYIEEKMVPVFQKYLSKKINEDKNVKAEIEYNRYILLEEVKEFEYPEDVRSTLIGIINELPDYYGECEKTC